MFTTSQQRLFRKIELDIFDAAAKNDVASKVDKEGNYIFTPWALSGEIITQIKQIAGGLADKTFLIADTVEIVPVLLCFGVNKCNITYVAPYIHKGEIARNLGVRVVQQSLLTWEPDMKFDVVIGNPPYQNKDYLLYTDFFKKSLELGKIVSMIMPARLESNGTKLKNHNRLIKEHQIHISDDISSHFNVGVGEIRNIIASASTHNPANATNDPLEMYDITYPERPRLAPRAGQKEFSYKAKNEDANGIPCIVSVYRGNNIQWRNIKADIVARKKKSMETNAPWLLLLQEHPSNGLFNTAIIRNTGVKWGSGVFVIDAETEQYAKDLEQWLTSQEIQNEVKKLLALKGNTHSISAPMLSKLPMHK